MNDKFALPSLDPSHDIYTVYTGSMVVKAAPVIFKHSVMAEPFGFGDLSYFPVMCVEKTTFGPKGPVTEDVEDIKPMPHLYAVEHIGDTWFLTFEQAKARIVDEWIRQVMTGAVKVIVPVSDDETDDEPFITKPKRVVPPDMDCRP